MPDDPDVLAAGLLELAEREVPPAGKRFEAGLRTAMRRERHRRRVRWRWMATAGCVAAVLVALVVALALPAVARHLPLPVGHELNRLDAQSSGLQALLVAQTADQTRLRQKLAARAVPKAKGRLHRSVAKRKSPGTTPSVWQDGWAWVRPKGSPGAGASRPAEVAPVESNSGSPSASPASSPSPTTAPSAPPTSTQTPTSP